MNNSYTHHCIKETFLQCFGNRLCLWRQILGLKKIVFKSRNGDDREIRENKLSRKKWKVQSRKLIVAKFCFRENLNTRSFLPLRYMKIPLSRRQVPWAEKSNRNIAQLDTLYWLRPKFTQCYQNHLWSISFSPAPSTHPHTAFPI